MTSPIGIQAYWDDEAKVWIASSNDVPGLVIEAPTWADVIREIELVLPELTELVELR
jgi:hypothetical protein